MLTLDTPGGLDAATRDINQVILGAPLPIIAFVYPEGARAASAGTYILYAAHLAAMAPATNLGAATPVSIMGAGGKAEGDSAAGSGAETDGEDQSSPSKADSEPAPADAANTMARKAVNDSVAYIRGLAERRGRNADWAEQAVRQAVSASVDEALALGVIELKASSVPALLQAAHGPGGRAERDSG